MRQLDSYSYEEEDLKSVNVDMAFASIVNAFVRLPEAEAKKMRDEMYLDFDKLRLTDEEKEILMKVMQDKTMRNQLLTLLGKTALMSKGGYEENKALMRMNGAEFDDFFFLVNELFRSESEKKIAYELLTNAGDVVSLIEEGIEGLDQYQLVYLETVQKDVVLKKMLIEALEEGIMLHEIYGY